MTDNVRHLPRVPIASVQGTLALDLAPEQPPVPEPRPPHPRRHDLVPIDPQHRAGFDLWFSRYLQTVAEAVAGDRSPSQLVRWTSSRVYDDLVRRAQLVSLTAGPGPRAQVRPQVVSLHSSFVDDHRCEVAAVLRYGALHRALAARFELHEGHLRCTALEFA